MPLTQKEAIMEMLAKGSGLSKTPELSETELAAKAANLVEALGSYMTVHEFEVGDLVQFKPLCKIRNWEGPGIVVEILDEPVLNKEEDAATPFYCEALNIIVGDFIDGVLMKYHMDSQCLEPYDGPTVETLD